MAHHAARDPGSDERPAAVAEIRRWVGAILRDPNAAVFVWDSDTGPAGFCAVRIDRAPQILVETNRAEITDLLVRDGDRRRGVDRTTKRDVCRLQTVRAIRVDVLGQRLPPGGVAYRSLILKVARTGIPGFIIGNTAEDVLRVVLGTGGLPYARHLFERIDDRRQLVGIHAKEEPAARCNAHAGAAMTVVETNDLFDRGVDATCRDLERDRFRQSHRAPLATTAFVGPGDIVDAD